MKFNIIATPRSGHSAIAAWLASQDPEEKEYLADEKNTKLYSSNTYNYSLYHTNRSMYLCPYNNLFVIDAKLRSYLNNYSFGNILIDNQSLDFCDLRGFYNSPIYADKIIVLRDFYNTFASIIRHQERNKDRINNLRKLKRAWISQAKEALNITKVIPNKEIILYNKWITSKEYREKICKKLELTFTDNNFNRVPHHGSGSSFDRMEKDGQAQEMKVLERYEELKPDEKAILFNLVTPEIVNLNRRLFGGPHIDSFQKYYPKWYQYYLKVQRYVRSISRKYSGWKNYLLQKKS